MTWRVGTKLGRTLYRDEVCVGMVDTPELAAELVEAINAAPVRTEAEGGIHVPVRIDKAWRTELDQAVLDALAGVPEGELTHGVKFTLCGVALAELARRRRRP